MHAGEVDVGPHLAVLLRHDHLLSLGLSVGHGAVEGPLFRELQVLQVQLLNQHSPGGHYDLHHHKRQKHTNVQGWLSQGDVANGDDAGDD